MAATSYNPYESCLAGAAILFGIVVMILVALDRLNKVDAMIECLESEVRELREIRPWT